MCTDLPARNCFLLPEVRERSIPGPSGWWAKPEEDSSACLDRSLREKGVTAFILLQQNPPPPSTLPAASELLPAAFAGRFRLLAGNGRAAKGSKTSSAPQPETQQSASGLPDLFQTGLAPAEPLSPRARAHKSIKSPHDRSSSSLRQRRGHASELGGLLPAASPLSWWDRSSQSSSKHGEPGNSPGPGTG